jgi:uroporphyrinogen-III synthase
MFLVTRPLLKAKETAEALRKAGFKAVSLPLITIERIRNIPMRESHYDAVIITSTYTKHFLQTHLNELTHAKCELICVGKSSAKMLTECAKQSTSVSVSPQHIHIAEPENSEGILKITTPMLSMGQRVALIKGEKGRGLIEQELASQGIRVDTYDVYKRVAQTTPKEVKDIEHQPIRCIIVTSVDISEQVLSSFDAQWLQQRDWIATSKRIRDFLITKGIQNIRVSEGASTQAIVSCVQQFY